jgi:hypothetical protein
LEEDEIAVRLSADTADVKSRKREVEVRSVCKAVSGNRPGVANKQVRVIRVIRKPGQMVTHISTPGMRIQHQTSREYSKYTPSN